MLVLDDGFQHVRLDRNVDIVLIDALQPFGGGHSFPLGRLREPLRGVERAGVIVLTRCDGSDLAGAIVKRVRCWNSHAPVFESRVRRWSGWSTEAAARFRWRRRPSVGWAVSADWETRRASGGRCAGLGVHVVDSVEFSDHHRYRARELRHLGQQMAAQGATALVTTEKDAINLCESATELLGLPVYWLRIGIEIEREAEFLRAVERLIGRG